MSGLTMARARKKETECSRFDDEFEPLSQNFFRNRAAYTDV